MYLYSSGQSCATNHDAGAGGHVITAAAQVQPFWEPLSSCASPVSLEPQFVWLGYFWVLWSLGLTPVHRDVAQSHLSDLFGL